MDGGALSERDPLRPAAAASWMRRLPGPLPGLAEPPGPPVWQRANRFERGLQSTRAGVSWILSFAWAIATQPNGRHSGIRLRELAERLGGLWITFAQLLSRLLVPFSTELVEEVKATKYPPVSFPFDEARRLVEEELGEPLERLFASFDHVPFATLPFALIYRARIRLRRGEVEVTVRVLQPGARERLERDMKRIRRMLRLLRSLRLVPVGYLDEMLLEIDAARVELTDYRYERSHLGRLRLTLEGHKIRVLRAFKKWSARSVLTCEYIAAPSLDDLREARLRQPVEVDGWLIEHDIDPRSVGRRLIESFLRQVCEESEFDRNVAPRHVLLLRGNRIALVGARSVRTLHSTVRTTYSMMLRALASAEFEKAADCLLLLCDSLPRIDVSRVRGQIVVLFRRFHARARLHPASHREKSLFHLFREAIVILERHGIWLTWQVFDIQLGWSNLDECLALVAPEANAVKQIARFFRDAGVRRAASTRRLGLQGTVQRLMMSAGELAMFQGAELRRRARVFQATVGKGAFFLGTVVNLGRWAALLVLAASALGILHEARPEAVPSWIADRIELVLAGHHLPRVSWTVLAVGSGLLVLALGRFRKKLLEPGPGDVEGRR